MAASLRLILFISNLMTLAMTSHWARDDDSIFDEITEKDFEIDDRYKEYEGKSLVRFTPVEVKQLELLKRMEKRNSQLGIKFWTSPEALDRNVDVVIPSEMVHRILKFTDKHGINLDVVHRNIKSVFKREESGINFKFVKPDRFNLDQINSFNSTIAWLDDIASKCSFCQISNIGYSFERRVLKLIKIGTAPKGIFIDAGIHAREWGGVTSTLHLINKLVNTSDAMGQYLLDKYSFHIIPIANPDGFEFSRLRSREWRKTRTTKYSRFCPGVDPNRNFAVGFGGEGSSRAPCQEIYMGPYAFSEPETRALSNYITQKKAALVGYLAVHSYGNLVVYPWGCNNSVTYDYKDLDRVAIRMTSEIKETTGADYSFGPTAILLYIASGGSDDWAKGGANIKFSYTIEVGENFILPPERIPALAEQVVSGVKGMVDGMAAFYSKNQGKGVQEKIRELKYESI